MATRRSKKRVAESEDYDTGTLNTKSIERLVTAFSKSIKTAMTVGVAAASAATTAAIDSQYSRATTTKYNYAIDPYYNQSLSVVTKEGKYQWGQLTNIREGGTPIFVTVANAKTILDIFKDRATQYGLDHIINVLTTRTGRFEAQSWTLVGINYHNADLGNIKNLLKYIHALTTDHLRAYSGWYMGYENSTLTASTDMVIKAIDPNAAGNLGLVNRHKIRLRRFAAILHFTFKNNATRKSYTLFHQNKDKFVYKDEITGRAITCGLTLLKMTMTVMKPQIIVNHQGKERELEDLTLAKAGNNVRDVDPVQSYTWNYLINL